MKIIKQVDCSQGIPPDAEGAVVTVAGHGMEIGDIIGGKPLPKRIIKVEKHETNLRCTICGAVGTYFKGFGYCYFCGELDWLFWNQGSSEKYCDGCRICKNCEDGGTRR